ncbi:chromosome segregation protein [Umezawaea beigongshangensis]|uniref:chromosome segregation protein n=1 Tax=Umezawaea beigongshangensis TaxID=2780383 RepID=UPI0018F14C99|nr:chromosome segregation protein [Umezawaea beigongshangensis]
MGLADDRDLVPLGSGFDIVKRGYDRAQVEDHLERLDSDLRLLAADRDAAVSQTNDLARQLEAARSEMTELRTSVDRLSLPPTTLEGLSERLQRMLRLAQDEANEIKARAEAEGGHIRTKAENEASALRARYEKLLAELDHRRGEMEAEHRGVLEKARSEAAEIVGASRTAAETLERESEQRRTTVEEDFEIAMAARRGEAMRTLAQQEAASKAEAERRLREATDEAARVRAQIAQEQTASKAEAERLVRDATQEASRIRTEVTQEQTASRAEAERLVREATEEANRRRHDSITEATARVQEATDEAHRRVREATEESNRRITQATQRVDALRNLRNRLSQQLHAVRSALQEVTPLLDPLDLERESAVAVADAPPVQKAGPQRSEADRTGAPEPVAATGPTAAVPAEQQPQPSVDGPTQKIQRPQAVKP